MLSKTFLKKTKEKLLQEKQEIAERSTQRLVIDTDGDETDEIQGNILIEMQNQLNTRDHNKVTQINDAIKRIDDKNYGLCQECGEDIPEKRLSVNPYFLICITCAEEREAEIKQRKR